MKKIILLTLSLCAVTLVPYTASAQWVAPTAFPPSGNVPAPVNVGTIAQEKIGGLTIGGIITSVPAGYNSLSVKNKTTNQQVLGINPYGIAGQGYFNIWGSNDGGTWLSLITGKDGKVGIGGGSAPKIPVETLDVEGAIKIGNTTGRNAGTIRWTGQDFEGYDSTEWISLTDKGDVDDLLGGTCPTGQYISGFSNGYPVCSEPSIYTDNEFDFDPLGSTFEIPELDGVFKDVYVRPSPAVSPKKMVRAIVVSLSLYPDLNGSLSAGINEVQIQGYKNGDWPVIYNYAWNNTDLTGLDKRINSPTFIIPLSPNTEVNKTQNLGAFKIRSTIAPNSARIKGNGTIIAYIYGPNKMYDTKPVTVNLPVRVYNRGYGGHHMSCNADFNGKVTGMNFVFGRQGGPKIGQVCSDAFVKALAGNGSVVPSGSGTITIDQGSREISKTVTYTPSGLSELPIYIYSGSMVDGLLSPIEKSLGLAKYSCNQVKYSINRSFGWTGTTTEGTSFGSLDVTCHR